ncbi:MAG: ABC transporter ATP-binding protein [Firmicutes bacterium]|nr:ABC transporter ATP-binding protein [Bacillota bacterium]
MKKNKNIKEKKIKKKNKIITFILPVIAIIALLVIQAFCDLELPEYTASIINNGIQQNGIDCAVPEVLTEELYNAIMRITDKDKIIKNSYKLLEKEKLSKDDLKEVSSKYPVIKKENIYILQNLKDEEKYVLEEKIIKPLIITMMLKNNNESLKSMLMINLQEDNSLLNFLMVLDETTFDNIITAVNERLNNLDDSIIKQYGVISVKDLYTLVNIDMNKYQMNYIISNGIKMLIVAGIGMLVAILVGYLASKVAARISYVLRDKVVKKIMSFNQTEFKTFSLSSLITRATNDIEQVKHFFIMMLRTVVFAPIIGIGAFIKVYDNPLNWLIAVALISILILLSVLFSLSMPKFKSMQKLLDKLNLVSREIITGMPVIRTFGTERYEEKRFDKANLKLTKTNLFINRLMGIMMPSMMLVMNIISILIVWYGSKEIDLGTLQIGTLLAFISYTMQIIMSFLMISMLSIMLPRAIVSIKRIKEVLKMELSIKETIEPKEFNKDKKGIIEFKNVSFKYPDADEAMLKNISFKATPGTTTAFIGSTGSGKSTLVNLVPRFFDVTEGEILVDGVNIKDVRIKDLRDKIGYVPQKGFLFSGTITSNLELGKDNLTEEELKTSAKVSESLEFINKKEGKFESEISQGGSNVSGGQRQRLSIARAIAKNPDIYIFDDSFSALDFKTDASLRKKLKKYASEATILIVAQRISTIMNADNIIVLNEGECVGSGTHKELMKNCEIYKEIALSQLKEDEL